MANMVRRGVVSACCRRHPVWCLGVLNAEGGKQEEPCILAAALCCV